MRFFTFITLFLLALQPINQLVAQNSNLNVRLRSHVTYPTQRLANCYGYTKNGREYALLGANDGLLVVDVTNPDTPRTVNLFPSGGGFGLTSREIKTYKNYSYMISELDTGLQIVNLSNLPNPNLPMRQYTGDGAIAGYLRRAHTLHIDTLRGFLYLYGGLAGAIVLNLNPDPYQPKYVGQYNTNYIHDGYVHNDTLWAAHVFAGYFSIIDFRNKSNPIVLNTQRTPSQATHNTWLTDDRRTLLTTDESDNGFLAAYDISNPFAIRFLDKIQSNPGSFSTPHNTYIRNDYAITSWYRDGFTITDAHRPQNLIQVGNYDCYPQGSGGGWEGTWGVYPFAGSGNIIASNMEGEMYVLSPDYKRACYLEGLVIDSVTGIPIPNVLVKINSTDVDKRAKSNGRGEFFTGQVSTGTFTATFSVAGYRTKTIPVEFVAGSVTNHIVKLVNPLNNALFEPDANIVLKAYPNPFSTRLNIDYQLVEHFDKANLILYDVLGKAVWSKQITNLNGTLHCDAPLSAGVYMARIVADGRMSRSLKIIKTD